MMVNEDAVTVDIRWSSTEEIPKSASSGSPKSETRMFSGLMSRCSTPALCAYWRAAEIFTPTRSTSATGSGPDARRRSDRDPPEHNCIARYGDPSSAKPESNIVTMLGWLPTRPLVAASRRKRAFASAPARCTASTLSATSRCTDSCTAR